MSDTFTTREIMIAAAAREINDGEVVFVRFRLGEEAREVRAGRVRRGEETPRSHGGRCF